MLIEGRTSNKIKFRKSYFFNVRTWAMFRIRYEAFLYDAEVF